MLYVQITYHVSIKIQHNKNKIQQHVFFLLPICSALNTLLKYKLHDVFCSVALSTLLSAGPDLLDQQ